MSDHYDHRGFFTALGQHGPDVLVGLDPATVGWIRDVARTTDSFWSPNLEDRIRMEAESGGLRDGVCWALEGWAENVRGYVEDRLEDLPLLLDAHFGRMGRPDLVEAGMRSVEHPDWSRYDVDYEHPLIDALVEAARPKPPEESASD